MVSKLQKKGKKGFTLVELIVVIAIIAILAAVAVPTTMHFVDKANASKEGQQMNISSTIDNLIAEGISTPFNIADTSVSQDKTKLNNVIATKLNDMDANTNIGSIIVEISAVADGKHTIKYAILGAKYADWKEAQIQGTVSMKLTSAQVYGTNENIETLKAAKYYVTFNYKGSLGTDNKYEGSSTAADTKVAVGDTEVDSAGKVMFVEASTSKPVIEGITLFA